MGAQLSRGGVAVEGKAAADPAAAKANGQVSLHGLHSGQPHGTHRPLHACSMVPPGGATAEHGAHLIAYM